MSIGTGKTAKSAASKPAAPRKTAASAKAASSKPTSAKSASAKSAASVPAKRSVAAVPARRTPAAVPAKRPAQGEALLARVESVRMTQRGEGNFDCFGRAGEGYCDQGGCVYRDECLSVSRMLHSM